MQENTEINIWLHFLKLSTKIVRLGWWNLPMDLNFFLISFINKKTQILPNHKDVAKLWTICFEFNLNPRHNWKKYINYQNYFQFNSFTFSQKSPTLMQLRDDVYSKWKHKYSVIIMKDYYCILSSLVSVVFF